MSEIQPELFPDPLELAKQLKRLGRYKKAERHLLSHLDKNPDDSSLQASLADLYYRTNRPRQAMRLAGVILRNNPNEHRALVVMGNALLSRDKTDQALEYFHLANQIAETEYVWTCIARTHLARKQPQQALDALSAAKRYANPNAHMHSIHVRAQLMQGDQQAFEQAVLQMAQDAPPAHTDFFRTMIPLLQKLSPSQILQTLTVLRKNNLQRDNPQLLLFELEISFRCQDLARARQCLTALESLDQLNTYHEARLRYAEKIEQQHKYKGKPLC